MNFKTTAVISLSLVLITFSFSVFAQLPTGRWEYIVYVNDEEAGKGSVRRTNINDGTVKTASEMQFQAGLLMAVSSETIIEKRSSFSPVSYYSKSTLMNDDAVRSSEVTAIVKNNVMFVKPKGDKSLKFKISSPLFFGTNSIIDEFKSKGFPETAIIRDIYDPSVDPARSLRLSAVLTKLSAKQSHIFRIECSDNKKKIMTLFVNSSGVVVKYSYYSSKYKVEMVLPEYAP